MDSEYRRPAGRGAKSRRGFETPTAGYTFLNASVGYKFRVGPTYSNVYLRGVNLTNEEGRDHLSFLKEVLPLPGRSIIVGLRTTF